MGKSDKALLVIFGEGDLPEFKFNGAWNIRNLGHVRSMLFRAYKHYIRSLKKEEVK